MPSKLSAADRRRLAAIRSRKTPRTLNLDLHYVQVDPPQAGRYPLSSWAGAARLPKVNDLFELARRGRS